MRGRRSVVVAGSAAAAIVTAAIGAGAGLVLWVLDAAPPRPAAPARSIEAEAFRILPWSRLARAPDAAGRIHVRLRAPAPGVSVRVLGTSCGCARAGVDARGVLTVTLRRAPAPARVRVRLGVTRAGAHAVRTLQIEPQVPRGRRAPIVVRHEVRPDDPERAGSLHARLQLPDGTPPRLVTTAPLHAVVHPMARGGYEVRVFGHGRSRALREPGVLVTAQGRIPLRIFRAGTRR